MRCKLYRSRRDSKIFGLCGGLAEAFNVDATLVRLVVAVTTFFSGGTVILLYIIASMVIPKEPGFEGPFSYETPFQSPHHHAGPAQSTSFKRSEPAPNDHLDEMMKDIEQKALRKELEELRAKVAQYENNQQKGEI